MLWVVPAVRGMIPCSCRVRPLRRRQRAELGRRGIRHSVLILMLKLLLLLAVFSRSGAAVRSDVAPPPGVGYAEGTPPRLLDVLSRGAEVDEDEDSERDGRDAEEHGEDELLVGQAPPERLEDCQGAAHPCAQKQHEDVGVGEEQ